MVKKATICDSSFLPHTKSASIGGDNVGIGPTDFEWELTDVKTARFVTDSHIKEAQGKGQIAWLLEPPGLHPENYLSAVRGGFDAVLTHSLDWVDEFDNCFYYPYGGSWVHVDRPFYRGKKRLLSMIASTKNTMSGHRLRQAVREKWGQQKDIYGRGHNPIERKITGLAPYFFSIVIESERVRGYFTEKLIDCLTCGTIPIYWGDPAIGDHFDTDGFIVVNTIDGIRDAFALVGKNYWLDRGAVVEKNRQTAKKYRVCEDYIFRNYPWIFG